MAQSKASSGKSLSGLRSQIDRLDREIVKKLNDRARLVVQIGNLKNDSGQAVYDADREARVLSSVSDANSGPLTNDCVRAIFREIISGSRALEQVVRVAYLGPAYTYSHLAALDRFGQSAELVPVGTIGAAFEEVNRGHVSFAVVPIENSTDGRVADTLEMFTRLRVRICGEVQIPIRHYLLGRGQRADIREIYSRPQALSQCRNWLARHMPGARLIEVTSTSTAAQLAHDKQGAAAIASREAGVHYGLDNLAADIEDHPGNVTRFAVIGKESAKRTGCDSTDVMFEVEHKPGALADAMTIFKKNRLNLTWIESFPIPDSRGKYLFFVELEGHESEARVVRALTALGKKALRLEVLGSFGRTRPSASPAKE
jgi:chorismate mutase/prephenate dehydratase